MGLPFLSTMTIEGNADETAMPRISAGFDLRFRQTFLDHVAGSCPVAHRIMLGPTGMVVIKGILSEGEAQNLALGIDDAGFATACSVINAQ